MAEQVGVIDLSNLIAAINAMTLVLGENGSTTAASIVNNLTDLNTTLAEFLNAGVIAAKWLHISGAGTFQAPGTVAALLTVNINTDASGATAELYDASSPALPIGTVMIANMDLGTIDPVSIPMGPPNRGLKLNNGLVVVTTGAADITVSYV
jgi:hypothetical protein